MNQTTQMADKMKWQQKLGLVAGAALASLGLSGMMTMASADTTYTVQSGDTLSSIAQKFNNVVSVDQLAQDNQLSNPNLIMVGQQLTIKDGSGDQSQAPVQAPAVNAAPATTGTGYTGDYTSYQQPAPAASYSAPATNYQYQAPATGNGGEDAARNWIAARESGGSYNARNGQYIGKYQLSASYLNGDYSPANQERVAQQYVVGRYGSWQAAQAHWQANGWY